MKKSRKINQLNDYRNWGLDSAASVFRWIFVAFSVVAAVIIIKNDLPMDRCFPVFAIQWLYIFGETTFRELCHYRVAFEKDGKLVSPLDLLKDAEEVECNLYACSCEALCLYEPLAIFPSEMEFIDKIEISYAYKTVLTFACYFKGVKIYENFIDLGQYHSKEIADLMESVLKEREGC